MKKWSSSRLPKRRCEYIDILKGFTIIWVLWMHMDLPEFIYPSVQMPIFFFISGTFYHAQKTTLWKQIKSDAYRLLLPAFVFSLLALIYLFLNRKVQLNSVIEIIDKSLSVAIVWFLLALFYFRTISYTFVKIGKPLVVIVIALLVYVPGFYLYANENYWVIPFLPLSHMGVFMIWFALGLLYGERTLRLITSPRSRIKKIFVLLAFVYILIVHGVDFDSGIFAYIPCLCTDSHIRLALSF